MRCPGHLIFLLALSPRRCLEDALKTLTESWGPPSPIVSMALDPWGEGVMFRFDALESRCKGQYTHIKREEEKETLKNAQHTEVLLQLGTGASTSVGCGVEFLGIL
jgi:hypothetical protein